MGVLDDFLGYFKGGDSGYGQFLGPLLSTGIQSMAGMYNNQNTTNTTNAYNQQSLAQQLEIEKMREASAQKISEQQTAEAAAAAAMQAAAAQQATLQRAYEAAIQGQNTSEGINQGALNSFIANLQNAYRFKS
jgi:hypothetical protein